MLPGRLAALEQEFADKRAEPVADLSPEEIDRLAAIYMHEELASDEEARQDPLGGDDPFALLKAQLAERGIRPNWTDEEADRTEPGMTEREYEKRRESLEIAKMGLGAAVARGHTSIIQQDLADLLARHRIKLRDDVPAHRTLSLAVLKAAVKMVDLQLRRHAGEIVDTPPLPVTGPMAGAKKQGNDPTLSDIYERWKLERKPPEKTASDFWTYCRRFIELHGDLPVTAITKRHVVDFKDALLRLPTKLPAAHAIWPMPRILKEYADNAEVPRLSSSTVNEKGLAAIKAMLNWASSNAFCELNVAAGVRAVTGKVIEDSRLPYSTSDLKTIFSFPVFSSGERPKGGAGEAAFWLPILALYTGARLEEIGSLRLKDCQTERGVSYFDLTTIEPGKKLKTNSSRRKIPYHPKLVELGWTQYVEHAAAAGWERLFPDLHSTTGEVTANWSKWWGRYARIHGITDKRKVFHSFRHTFIDACRDNGVSKEHTQAIDGHGRTSVEDSYGLGYSVPILAEAIAKVRYDGISIPIWSAIQPVVTGRRPPKGGMRA